MTDHLATAIERLPEREKLVVTLRYYEELPEREIAEALDVSLATVRQLTYRALTRLRGTLGPPPD